MNPATAPKSLKASALRRALPLLRGLGAVFLLAFILEKADIRALWGLFRAAPWWALVVPAVCLVINTAIQAVRLHLLLPAPGPALAEVLRAYFMANFVGLALPAGAGDAVKVLTLRRHSRLGVLVAALAETRVQDLGMWGCLLVIGLVSPLPQRVPLLVPVAWVGAVVMLGAWLFLMPLARATAGWSRLPPKLATALAPFSGEGVAVPARRWSGVLTVPFVALNVLSVWVILQGYQVMMPPLDVARVVAAADVLISLPITVGGLGVREHAYALSFEPWGCSVTQAVAVALTRWAAEWGRAGIGAALLIAGRAAPARTG